MDVIASSKSASDEFCITQSAKKRIQMKIYSQENMNTIFDEWKDNHLKDVVASTCIVSVVFKMTRKNGPAKYWFIDQKGEYIDMIKTNLEFGDIDNTTPTGARRDLLKMLNLPTVMSRSGQCRHSFDTSNIVTAKVTADTEPFEAADACDDQPSDTPNFFPVGEENENTPIMPANTIASVGVGENRKAQTAQAM